MAAPNMAQEEVEQKQEETPAEPVAEEKKPAKKGVKAHVSDEKKRELLQRSWVAVNPSSMEGWGVTNIEANACGTPVVGADVPGIRDSIADGTSGVLVPHADVDALTDALRGLIGDPTRLEQISESSMEWAGNFSWERSADRLFSVLQRAVFLEKKESE